MNDTPLPNSTIRPARDRRQAFDNNYTNGLCHRDDLAR